MPLLLFLLHLRLPLPLLQVLGLDLLHSGAVSVLPWVAMAGAANFAGWAADTLVAKGVSVTTVRKVGGWVR